MQLHEPMTLATDYALGLLCAALALRMRSRGSEAGRAYWVGAFAGAAASAGLGGTYHGFLPWLAPWVAAVLWKSTLLAIGGAAYGAGMATVRAHLAPARQRLAQVLLGLQLAVYAAIALARDEFLVASLDYSLVFGFVLAVHVRVWRRERDQAAGWVSLGVLVTFLGAAIQASGVALHAHFNHNDLFHVVQMAGSWALYRGASRTFRPGR